MGFKIMSVLDLQFVKEFIQLAKNGYSKGWHERNGGNLSYRLTAQQADSVRKLSSPGNELTPLGIKLPNLAGEFFLVTGTGKFFRNVALEPADNIAVLAIDDKGENYSKVWGLEKGGGPTSELPTHLMNHSIKKEVTGDTHRVIYHCHPPNAIAMTFVLPLENKAFSKALWGVMTECPIIFPQGVGVTPWMIPGGREIALATGELIRKYDVIIWAHHGVFCSGEDFDSAFGLMEAVEKAAEIFVKVKSMNGTIHGISDSDFRELGKHYNVVPNEEFLEG
jgi:rhamnulose-1-phosphate aldolase